MAIHNTPLSLFLSILKVKVSHPDGRPVTQTGERLKISVTLFTDKKVTVPTQFLPPYSPSSNLMTFMSPFPDGSVVFMPDSYMAVPRDGIVKIELDIPEGVITGNMKVSCRSLLLYLNIVSIYFHFFLQIPTNCCQLPQSTGGGFCFKLMYSFVRTLLLSQ